MSRSSSSSDQVTYNRQDQTSQQVGEGFAAGDIGGGVQFISQDVSPEVVQRALESGGRVAVEALLSNEGVSREALRTNEAISGRSLDNMRSVAEFGIFEQGKTSRAGFDLASTVTDRAIDGVGDALDTVAMFGASALDAAGQAQSRAQQSSGEAIKRAFESQRSDTANTINKAVPWIIGMITVAVIGVAYVGSRK